MTPVLLIIGGLGFGMVYSAITGQPFLETLRTTFTSPASQRVRPPSKPILEERVNVDGSGGAMTPGGTDDGFGGGGAGARIAAPPAAQGGSGGNPCRAMPVPTNLVRIGQGGHSLEAAAAASLSRAETAAGTIIRVTDSFRTFDQQEDCHRRKPTLCAAPGGSCHEKGRAIDIVDMKNQRIIDALTAEGWQRFDPAREPWHWSYQVRG